MKIIYIVLSIVILSHIVSARKGYKNVSLSKSLPALLKDSLFKEISPIKRFSSPKQINKQVKIKFE